MRQYTKIPSKNAPKRKMFAHPPTVASMLKRGGQGRSQKGFKPMGK